MTDSTASPSRPRTATASRPSLAEPITSRANPFVRDVRALRERSRREASGRLFVEGIRLVTAAVRQGHRPETLLVSPDTLTSALALDLVHAQAAAGVPVRHCTAHVFAGLSWRERPQGLGAILRQRWTPLAALSAGGGPPGSAVAAPGWIALDAVRDPGNLGTILRTADAAGCAGVILLGHTADPYDPVAVRASMGAVFALPLVRTDFPALLAWCARTGVPLVGTSPLAPVDYRAARYRPPVVLLMGNERTGLSPQQQAACSRVVRIPMAGQSDSLNLAVATGIMLFELRRAGPAP
jgi:TrmH family RNA methyltransferase